MTKEILVLKMIYDPRFPTEERQLFISAEDIGRIVFTKKGEGKEPTAIVYPKGVDDFYIVQCADLIEQINRWKSV